MWPMVALIRGCVHMLNAEFLKGGAVTCIYLCSSAQKVCR